ncbi:MAG: hypothetical protein JO060_10410, partial [Candidatus Eremiobacteraeota bacterium]|nr:hypothetical protein [Candidatus Eremiobacteraeota bacterium]
MRVSGGRLAVAAPRGQAPTLRIELFGTMRVEADGAPLHASMRTEALRLLAFLIVRRHTPMARDQVAFTLWPDSTEESARATLRRQLYNLRIGVPATQKPLLEVDGEMLQWNAHAGVLVDVVEFERCADRDDAGAIEFYAGDLLEQMDDEWVMPERTRLRALYVEVLWRLASRARARRDGATAERYLQRLLSTDPWREDAVRSLMSVRYENGDAAAALAACADFETRLRDEIGAGLMRETVQLREAIVRHEPIARPAVANNLPAHTSSFVGRDDDVAHIATLVCAQSLVTLVGAGGVGKTRTAIHVGAMLLDEYDDGVWLIELAPLVHARQIAPTAATVLGVRSSADKPALDALLNDVAKRRMLILLDNCEHIVEGAAAFVDAILRAAPNVHVLATSRESLRASEETVYRLPSLAYPSANGTLTAEQAARYGAIALFASRAGAANPAVRLTDETAPLVCELCRRLDGIALAIELAAARVNVLSLPEIAQGLDDRFRLLAVGK